MNEQPPANSSARSRKTAIDITLPALSPLIDHWRAPVTAVVPPHITLLYPWRPAPLRRADLAEATAALAEFSQFTITFRRLGRFPGVLFLHPEPENVLLGLIRRLIAAFSDTPPYGGLFPDPDPHLTVAKAPTEEALDRLEAKVTQQLAPHLPLTFVVQEIAIEEEGKDGIWSLHTAIPLNQRA